MTVRTLPMCLALLALAFLAAVPALADDKKDKDTHEGLVVQAKGDRLTMTDMDGKNEHSHQVAADAKITLDGKDCTLADLPKGAKIKVSMAVRGDSKVAGAASSARRSSPSRILIEEPSRKQGRCLVERS